MELKNKKRVNLHFSQPVWHGKKMLKSILILLLILHFVSLHSVLNDAVKKMSDVDISKYIKSITANLCYLPDRPHINRINILDHNTNIFDTVDDSIASAGNTPNSIKQELRAKLALESDHLKRDSRRRLPDKWAKAFYSEIITPVLNKLTVPL
jgi:hypothetical protein